MIVRQESKQQEQREIDFAKRLIFIDKIAKNAIKTMTFDRKLGILTQFSNLLLFKFRKLKKGHKKSIRILAYFAKNEYL